MSIKKGPYNDGIDNNDSDGGSTKDEIITSTNMERRFTCRVKNYIHLINEDQETCRSIKFTDDNRHLALPLEKQKVLRRNCNGQEESFNCLRKFLVFGVMWISLLTDNIVSHPFIVLRRQCQVYASSNLYHLHPFNLWPSVVQLQRRQGLTTFWKGFGSCLLVRNVTLVVDNIILKLSSWPKRTSLLSFGQHVLLKCISIHLMLPFQAEALRQTVETNLMAKKWDPYSFLYRASTRLYNWWCMQSWHMLPAIRNIMVPSIAFGLSKHLFKLVIRGVFLRIMHRRLERAKDGSKCHKSAELIADLIASVVSEAICYPFETILNRLQLQDIVTIIDNLDNGATVVPIFTKYDGVLDCARCTIVSEGYWGLYKGFGAMMLQFMLQMVLVKITKSIVDYLTKSRAPSPPDVVPPSNTSCAIDLSGAGFPH